MSMPCFEIRDQLEAFLAPLVAQEGLELLDLEWRPEQSGWTLRLVLDKESSGVTLTDCELISRKVGTKLDETSLLGHAYSLEVSSSGLRRPLKQEKDFHKFTGERVRIELKQPVEGTNQKVVVAILQGYENGRLVLVDGSKEWQISQDQIEKANLDPIIEV